MVEHKNLNTSPKRAFYLTDIHFGLRSNSNEWVQIHDNYFNDFLIPLIENNYKEGDYLFILGDVYDNRTSINLSILNSSLDIFNKLSNILPIIIFPGNHDIFKKDDRSINSLRHLSYINNITVFENPTLLNIHDDHDLLIVPWMNSKKLELDVIQSLSKQPRYILMHTDFVGMKLNQYHSAEVGIEYQSIDSSSKVWSGHIHIQQRMKNVHMLGSPFQMTKSDANNEKGILLYDFESLEEKWFINDKSPKFKNFHIHDILKKSDSEVINEFNGNFIDISINEEESLLFPMIDFIESHKEARKINFITILNNDINETLVNFNIDNFEILDCVYKYIDSLDYKVPVKKYLKNFTKEIYEKAKI